MLVLLGIPLISTDFFRELISGEDAVTSASVVVKEPSGEYLVMINDKLHADNADVWADFFQGSDYSGLFEDVICCVPLADKMALEFAESSASKLPENQMKIRKEDPVFLMSLADEGRFDIIIMSVEFSDMFDSSTAYSDDVTVVTVSGDED